MFVCAHVLNILKTTTPQLMNFIIILSPFEKRLEVVNVDSDSDDDKSKKRAAASGDKRKYTTGNGDNEEVKRNQPRHFSMSNNNRVQERGPRHDPLDIAMQQQYRNAARSQSSSTARGSKRSDDEAFNGWLRPMIEPSKCMYLYYMSV